MKILAGRNREKNEKCCIFYFRKIKKSWNHEIHEKVWLKLYFIIVANKLALRQN